MARKLKTYQTSVGFFDLAVAAPSMNAAARAWGLKTSEFKRGFAKETHDPAIVAATMVKPGVVLRRPVGSNASFSEHPKLPKDLPVGKERSAKPRRITKQSTSRKLDDKAERAAALAFEKEQKRREMQCRREQAARDSERKRRERAIAKLERALEAAKRHHDTNVKKIEKDRTALDERLKAENKRWENETEKLDRALRRASD
jgi:hypothetical protein